MKRTILLLIAAALSVSCLAGCAGTTVVIRDGGNSDPSGNSGDGAVKLGLAFSPNVGNSAAATADTNGKAAFDVTVAAVLVDGTGVILACIIDSLGADIPFNGRGQVIDFDASRQLLTKNELGENYGMKTYGGAKYEWYQQVAALAEYAVGKTVQELRSGAVNEVGKAKDAELAAVATIRIAPYVDTIEKAVANARPLGSKAGDALKLAINSTVTAVHAAEEDGSIQLTVDSAAVTLDGDIISGCYIDSLQVAVSFDKAGALSSDVSAIPLTKNELGERYGMKAYGGAKYEWDQQAANFAAYITGKEIGEVADIAVTDSAKPADGTDLAASVTISIAPFQALLEKAAKW